MLKRMKKDIYSSSRFSGMWVIGGKKGRGLSFERVEWERVSDNGQLMGMDFKRGKDS